MIDSISADGRLKLAQEMKDRFVVENLRRGLVRRLHPEFHGFEWIHGPFDTNLLVERKNGEVQSLVLEYDTLLVRWMGESVEVMKSFAMAEDAEGYSHLWKKPRGQKVAIGASWADRLANLLSEAQKSHPEFQNDLKSALHFLQVLKRD
jgi:hypothetical protein